MTLSSNRAAYADCFALLERALATPRGIIVRQRSEAAAFYLRMRLNQARAVDCAANKRIYADQPHHYLHNNSEFYALAFKVVQENEEIWQVRIEKPSVSPLLVEEIPPHEGEEIIAGAEKIMNAQEEITDEQIQGYNIVEDMLADMERNDEFDLGEAMDDGPPGEGRARRF